MEGSPEQGSLEEFLSGSEFKRQVELLGHDVFSMLLDLYGEGKINPELRQLFPAYKDKEFDKVYSELLTHSPKIRSGLYHCLMDSDDSPVKEVLGGAYGDVIRKKAAVVKRLGYDAIYRNFINAQANDSLMDAEGDGFFYIGNKKASLNGKDNELVWVFAKVVEFLYGTSFR